MRGRQSFKTLSLLLLLLFLVCDAVRSQTIVTGALSGTISDPSGASISGANLTLKSSATGESLSTSSAASGDYHLRD